MGTPCRYNFKMNLGCVFVPKHQLFLVLPGLSNVKISPSHLAALLGVLGSELQLERRRLFLLGETCSSVAESKSTCIQKKIL